MNFKEKPQEKFSNIIPFDEWKEYVNIQLYGNANYVASNHEREKHVNRGKYMSSYGNENLYVDLGACAGAALRGLTPNGQVLSSLSHVLNIGDEKDLEKNVIGVLKNSLKEFERAGIRLDTVKAVPIGGSSKYKKVIKNTALIVKEVLKDNRVKIVKEYIMKSVGARFNYLTGPGEVWVRPNKSDNYIKITGEGFSKNYL